MRSDPMDKETVLAIIERDAIDAAAYRGYREDTMLPGERQWHADRSVAARATVEGLWEERERLAEKVAEFESIGIRRVMVENGRADIALGGEAIAGLAEVMAEWYEQKGGPNYCEMTFTGNGREYVLTMQRADGKTPHQLRLDAEDRATRAEAVLKEAGAERDVMRLKLVELAGCCAECDGDGWALVECDKDEDCEPEWQPCEACADIRAAIPTPPTVTVEAPKDGR
jgi:hypothetical protein